MQKVKESDDQRKGIEHDRQAGLPEDGEESNREMAEGLEGKTEEQLEEEAEKSEDESEIKESPSYGCKTYPRKQTVSGDMFINSNAVKKMHPAKGIVLGCVPRIRNVFHRAESVRRRPEWKRQSVLFRFFSRYPWNLQGSAWEW